MTDCRTGQAMKHTIQLVLLVEPKLPEHKIRPKWFRMLRFLRQERIVENRLRVRTAIQDG